MDNTGIVQKRELLELKRIPIGIEDFKEIIDQGYYHMDKASLLELLWYRIL